MKLSGPIVWAVDPYENTLNNHWKAAEWIRGIAAEETIQPVHVYAIGSHFSSFQDLIEEQDKIQDFGKKRFEDWAETTKLDQLKPLMMLEQSYPSARRAAEQVSQYAKLVGAAVIVVNTHARTGIKRVYLGSFAESLVLCSSVPVVTLNPKSSYKSTLKSIVVPVDLSSTTEKQLPKVIELAKKMDAKICFIHKHVDFTQYAIPWGGVSFLPASEKEIVVNKKQRLDSLVERVEALGVSASGFLDRSKRSVADAILAYAKRHPSSMIVMMAQVGQLGTLLAGSTTRELMRRAPYPVWVMRATTEPKKRIRRRWATIPQEHDRALFAG